MPSDLVPAAEVAPHYGVTPQTVTEWAKDGKIPTAVLTAGGHRRFRLADVFAVYPPADSTPVAS